MTLDIHLAAQGRFFTVRVSGKVFGRLAPTEILLKNAEIFIHEEPVRRTTGGVVSVYTRNRCSFCVHEELV